jgi:hypothetical protein
MRGRNLLPSVILKEVRVVENALIKEERSGCRICSKTLPAGTARQDMIYIVPFEN